MLCAASAVTKLLFRLFYYSTLIIKNNKTNERDVRRRCGIQGGIGTGWTILTFFLETGRLWKMARARLPERARAEHGQRTV